MFRSQPPQEEQNGNVRALAIRDLVASKPLQWNELPRILLDEGHLSHCLQPGDVVTPSRGDYYKAWLFEGASEPVFPLGQLNVITPGPQLDARYLVSVSYTHLQGRLLQALGEKEWLIVQENLEKQFFDTITKLSESQRFG